MGPWPVSGQHWLQSPYARRSLARAEAVSPAGPPGPLSFSAAKVQLPWRQGEPLAGYSARSPKAGLNAQQTLWARAITVSNGHATVTFISAEILLFLPELRQSVLNKTGLDETELYFCSTHTHSGPGGYARGPAHELVLGRFDPQILDRLAGAIAEAIEQSRQDLTPCRIDCYRKVLADETGSLLEDRIRNRPSPAVLSALRFQPLSSPGPSAMLVTFDAHPTLLSRHNRSLSGDYPGHLASLLESDPAGLGVAMFAAGAVGSARFRHDLRQGENPHVRTARKIHEKLKEALETPERSFTEGKIASRIVWIDLPRPQIRLTENLCLSPVLGSVLHERRTFVQAVRLGPVAFTAFPGDYSTELSGYLRQELADEGVFHVCTSFNGDYIGYLLPAEHYDSGHYETRTMGVFGRWCGQYITEVSRRSLRRIMDKSGI